MDTPLILHRINSQSCWLAMLFLRLLPYQMIQSSILSGHRTVHLCIMYFISCKLWIYKSLWMDSRSKLEVFECRQTSFHYKHFKAIASYTHSTTKLDYQIGEMSKTSRYVSIMNGLACLCQIDSLKYSWGLRRYSNAEQSREGEWLSASAVPLSVFLLISPH